MVILEIINTFGFDLNVVQILNSASNIADNNEVIKEVLRFILRLLDLQ